MDAIRSQIRQELILFPSLHHLRESTLVVPRTHVPRLDPFLLFLLGNLLGLLLFLDWSLQHLVEASLHSKECVDFGLATVFRLPTHIAYFSTSPPYLSIGN